MFFLLDEFVWNVAKKSEVFIEPNTACRTSLDNTLSGMMLCLKPEVKNCIVRHILGYMF